MDTSSTTRHSPQKGDHPVKHAHPGQCLSSTDLIPEIEQVFLIALMDGLPDYVYFKDMESRFICINKALAANFGLSDARKAVGKTDFDFFGREHADAALADERRIIGTGIPIVSKEEKEIWPDKHVTWVSTTKAPLKDRDGKIIGTFGISRDITAQKQFEHEHRLIELRLQKMQKAESMEILAGGVAHDMNNILGSILGNSDLALIGLSKTGNLYGKIEEIRTATIRAADLARQLLAYAGRGALALEPVDLGSTVKEMLRLLAVSIHKEIDLDIDLADDLPAIDGDPTQIRQVVMNLVINASDAIGKKAGRISVRTGVNDCDAAYLLQTQGGADLAPGRYVYVEIADTGCGIPPENREKMFTPFFTTKKTGRGLGLATIFGIIRGHQGAIRLYSEVGRGTSFKVLFKPGEKNAAAIDKKPQKSRAWRGSGTILLVDDEDTIRHVTGQMLRALGFQSLEAACGRSAIEIFRERKNEIRAVLLDEVMPHMAGDEVFVELRKIKPDVHVILCSGYGEKDALTKQNYAGIAGFLQKPFTLQLLSDKLQEVTGD